MGMVGRDGGRGEVVRGGGLVGWGGGGGGVWGREVYIGKGLPTLQSMVRSQSFNTGATPTRKAP